MINALTAKIATVRTASAARRPFPARRPPVTANAVAARNAAAPVWKLASAAKDAHAKSAPAARRPSVFRLEASKSQSRRTQN